MGGRAGGNRPLLARKQLSGDAAHGPDPRLTDMPWSHTTLEILRGPSTATTSMRSAAFAGIAETGRWRSFPGRRIRRLSIFSPTIISSSCRARRSRPITRACSPGCGALMARAMRRARSILYRPFPIGRYRADVCCLARMGPTTAYCRGRLNSCVPRAQRAINGMLIAVSILPQRENFYSQLQQTP